MLRWYDKRRTRALSDSRILGLASKSEIIVQDGMSNPSVQEIMSAAGIGRTHAYDILAGREPPSIKVALDIYDATGARLGLLAGLPDKVIEQLRENANKQAKAA
jgi:hypothetical protein